MVLLYQHYLLRLWPRMRHAQRRSVVVVVGNVMRMMMMVKVFGRCSAVTPSRRRLFSKGTRQGRRGVVVHGLVCHRWRCRRLLLQRTSRRHDPVNVLLVVVARKGSDGSCQITLFVSLRLMVDNGYNALNDGKLITTNTRSW